MLEAMNTTNVVQFATTYLQALPMLITQGDVGAIVVGLLLFYIGLIVVNKISYVLLRVIKYVVVVAIVSSAFYALVMTFIEKMSGAQPIYILLGLIGVGIGFVGVLIALWALFKQATRSAKTAKTRGDKMLAYQKHLIDEEKKELHEEKQKFAVEKEELKQTSLQQMIEKQSTLLTIITYILIAEFGVFSSVTISAPTADIGMIMFVMFTVGVLVYVLRTYPDPKMGLFYLGSAFMFAFLMSIVLGHFWAGHALNELLSMRFFGLDSLVAFITGIALSLFMGSKSN